MRRSLQAKAVLRRHGAGLILLAVLGACADARSYPADLYAGPDVLSKRGAAQPAAPTIRPAATADPAADAFARAFLNSVQPRSIAERREYCGYLIRTPSGQITATPPLPGTFASCSMPTPQPGQGIFASYHTHGAFGAGYDNEVPSARDLASDFALGIDGYVSTPGGRVWRNNRATRDTVQICGLGCVISDPGYRPQGEAGILPRFNEDQLRRRGQ